MLLNGLRGGASTGKRRCGGVLGGDVVSESVSIERINPGGLARPSGFSHAARATGGGLVFLAGQTALDQAGRIIGGTVVQQFERALRNLLAALHAAGGGPGDLASLTVYVLDVDDYRAHSQDIREIWRRLVGRDYPAMAVIGVKRLWDARALVEVQGIAVVSC
jgi:enamine deaminase RidA (YjgF/YER057c/UK114 family)